MTETQSAVLNNLYQGLMQVPHREIDPLVVALRNAMNEHPMFTSHACAYMILESKIRDQADAATIALLQAPASYPEYREAGRVFMLGNSIYKTTPYDINGLPPYRIFRVSQYMENAGVGLKSPRLMTSIMKDYLLKVQDNDKWFDSVVLHNRSDVKSAYHNYHIKMNDLARSVLIENDPPEGSKLWAVKTIAGLDDINEQARMIMEYQIPYRIAQTIVGKMTPAIGIALISTMTPTEALNARQWVQESGLLNMPEVRTAYQDKISNANSVASMDYRKSAQGSDSEVQAVVNRAKEKAIADEKPILGETDIWMDVSGSMDSVVEQTPAFASRIWPRCENVALLAHNNSAWNIRVENTGNPYQDVQKALTGLRATGGTNFACCLDVSIRNGRSPQRIVLLTDGGENGGNLANALVRYEENTGIHPQIIMIHFAGGNADSLTPRLHQAGFEVEKFDFTGDYYIFDQVAALLGGDVPKSFIERIMEIELPRRVR